MEINPAQMREQYPSVEDLVSALRHLTEYSIRLRILLWFNKRHASFMQRISALAIKMVDKFDARTSAAWIWMVGKIGCRAFKSRNLENPARELVSTLVKNLLIKRELSNISIHDRMLVINGLANLDCIQLPHVLDACLPSLMEELPSLKPEIFSLFIWSYGKLGHIRREESFRSSILKQCDVRFDALSVQQLSSIAWGLCRMEFPEARQFLIRFSAKVHPFLRDFVPLGIARFLDACHLLNHHPGDSILKMLSNRFSHFRSHATPALCAQALPAFAHFRGFDSVLFRYTLQALKDRYKDLAEVDQMVRILAAYSIADHLSPTFLEMTIAQILKSESYEDLSPAILAELWIGIISHWIHYGDDIEKAVPKKLMTMSKQAWIQRESNPTPHSILPEIQIALKSLDVTSSIIYIEPKTEIPIDIVALRSMRRVAFLVLDKSTVFHNQARRSTGRVHWKQRILRKLGYGVNYIEAKNWNELNADRRCHHLRRLLQDPFIFKESQRSEK